jgi:hypothetical protein
MARGGGAGQLDSMSDVLCRARRERHSSRPAPASPRTGSLSQRTRRPQKKSRRPALRRCVAASLRENCLRSDPFFVAVFAQRVIPASARRRERADAIGRRDWNTIPAPMSCDVLRPRRHLVVHRPRDESATAPPTIYPLSIYPLSAIPSFPLALTS